jgi:hypothetical protein
MAEESLIVVEEELDGYSVGEAADEDADLNHPGRYVRRWR